MTGFSLRGPQVGPQEHRLRPRTTPLPYRPAPAPVQRSPEQIRAAWNDLMIELLDAPLTPQEKRDRI